MTTKQQEAHRAIARDFAKRGIAELACAFNHCHNPGIEYRFTEAVQRKFVELAAQIVSLVETGELVPGEVSRAQEDAAFQRHMNLLTGLASGGEEKGQSPRDRFPVTSVEDPILTRADIMVRLKCSRETVRQWLKAGKLPPPDVAISRKTMGWKRSTLIDAGISI